ncbi:helix-turn-helix domain-containing protein [Aerosakkonemataceae cyanobacterium BLCC-F154]|uniref:Helix-turn-helix domain-containing protein n=1 Tax=Floridaenema fluviatile BLCC-F154 TaxID=3153640 RepID=A0ABV4YJH7_9CYAN
MSRKKSPDIGTNRENSLTELFIKPPRLSSRGKMWSGIGLEQHYLPPGETPEYSLEKFAIAINLGQSFEIERIADRHLEKGLMMTGAVGLCPVYIPQVIRWNRDANILMLSLDDELLSSHALELLDTDRYEMLPHLIAQDTLIYQMGLNLQEHLKNNDSDSRLYVESAANFLAVHLLQNYSIQKALVREYAGGLPKQQLRKVIDYIDAHLTQDISLDAIANYLGMSRYHFSRLFKQSTGLSPHQYVIQQRVERAKQLLRRGKLSIAETAIACGFNHQSHLHRHFKRLTGTTPGNFLNS